MRKSYVIFVGILLLLSFTGSGQSGGVSIGKGNLPAYEKAILEIVSESKGILIPRMTTTQRLAIFNGNDMEAKGLLVYDTTADCLYAWDGQIWNSFCNSGSVTVGSGNTFPGEPALGEIFFNTTTGQLYYYNGTTWVTTGNATVPAETLTTLTDNGDGTMTYVDENGAGTVINLAAIISGNETLTSLVDNGDGTMTYTDEDGAVTVIHTTVLGGKVQIADGTVDIDGDGTPDNNVSLQDIINNIGNIVSAQETLTTLTDNGDGTLIYVDENGGGTVIDLVAIISGNVTPTSLVDNGDGTYTFTDAVGAVTTISTNGTAISNTVAGHRIATVTEADGTVAHINETVTTMADHGDGTYTFTSEDATTTTINTIANEPWFGTDNKAAATLNTEDIYTMGHVAIGAVAVNANADLELASPTKGLLTNRVALTATTNPAPLSAHVAGMVVYNTATSGDVSPGIYYNDGTKWLAVAGGGIRKDVYSAEYAGATLVGTGLGKMTSDNTGAPTYMNYYEWTTTQSLQQEYQVVFRFTLPLNFVAWTATPITVDYVVSGVASIAVDAIPIGGSTVSVNGSSTTWAQVSLSPVMVAGQTAVIVLKLRSTNGGIARVGDITLNYRAK